MYQAWPGSIQEWWIPPLHKPSDRTSDGGVFAFGDARFHGSTGALRLNRPVVSLTPSPLGGYWMVATDGGIFAFDVPFHGSLPGLATAGAGQRDPKVLAEMAKGRMRSKIPQLQDAMAGRFNEHHALLCRAMLARIDQADATVETLGVRIDELLDPYEAAVSLLVTIPGVARRSAQVILAEIGADMSRFPTAGHLASWAGMCPGNNESAGKHRSGRTRHGSKWLRKALVEAGQAAARTKDTYLAAQYAQIRGRRGPQRAAVAVGHSILVIAWHLLTTGEPYNDLGGDYFDRRRNSVARQRRLVGQLEAMGHRVTLEPAA